MYFPGNIGLVTRKYSISLGESKRPNIMNHSDRETLYIVRLLGQTGLVRYATIRHIKYGKCV